MDLNTRKDIFAAQKDPKPAVIWGALSLFVSIQGVF